MELGSVVVLELAVSIAALGAGKCGLGWDAFWGAP
jgi:hypothetical protein